MGEGDDLTTTLELSDLFGVDAFGIAYETQWGLTLVEEAIADWLAVNGEDPRRNDWRQKSFRAHYR